MANGYSRIPSVSSARRHRQNRGQIPEWVLRKTHGSARERASHLHGPARLANPEELPNLRTIPTGLGPGQVFLFNPRWLYRSRFARR